MKNKKECKSCNNISFEFTKLLTFLAMNYPEAYQKYKDGLINVETGERPYKKHI